MVRMPDKYKEQFLAIDQLRVITEQEGKVALFIKARDSLNIFWRECESAREAFLAGESDLVINENSFRNLTQAYQELLLLNVPKELHDEVREAASQSVRSLIEDWRKGLGNIEVLALADLELKVLAKLTLKVSSDVYRGETRLPDWNREIIQANREIELSCNAWRELAER